MTDERAPFAGEARADDEAAGRIDALVAGLDVAAPPPGFAAGVVAAHRRRAAGRTLWRRAAAACAGVAALACAAVVAGAGAHGDLVAAARESVAIGKDVIAVLEPQARVRYEAPAFAGLFGARPVVVEQRAGKAFYRVDKGTPVTVQTPAGDVLVHGTCFTVDLQEKPIMPVVTRAAPSLRSGLTPRVSAIAGAAAGVILTVAVLEGAVEVRNARGHVDVAPGEVVSADADSAPVVQVKAPRESPLVYRLRAQNEDLKAALDNARHAAGSGDVQKVLAENESLREKLRKDEEQLARAEQDRKATQGEPLPFPDDLPPRFSQQSLLRSFTAALTQAGIEGDVTHIDCDEYPCIVYGDVKATSDVDASAISRKMKDADAFAPYKDDEDNSSWWRSLKKDDKTGETVDETHFGIALWPKVDQDNDPNSDAIGRRIGFRNQQMWDAMKPAH